MRLPATLMVWTVLVVGKKGFSLVELIVVIAIISTLTAVLLPNLLGSRERARDTQKIDDLNSLKNALRLYYNDKGVYPTGVGVVLNAAGLSTYMPGIAGVGHTYYQTNAGDGFNLCVDLEGGAGDSDIDSQKKCGIGVTAVCGTGQTIDKLYAVCAN